MAVGQTHKEGMGESTNAVNVDLLYTVAKDRLIVADGWLGVADANGESGEAISMSINDVERQIWLPADFAGVKGDLVFITVATVTGHYPDDAAYTKTAGAGKLLYAKLTSDQDDNDIATAIVLGKGQMAS